MEAVLRVHAILEHLLGNLTKVEKLDCDGLELLPVHWIQTIKDVWEEVAAPGAGLVVA